MPCFSMCVVRTFFFGLIFNTFSCLSSSSNDLMTSFIHWKRRETKRGKRDRDDKWAYVNVHLQWVQLFSRSIYQLSTFLDKILSSPPLPPLPWQPWHEILPSDVDLNWKWERNYNTWRRMIHSWKGKQKVAGWNGTTFHDHLEACHVWKKAFHVRKADARDLGAGLSVLCPRFRLCRRA